MKAQQPLPLDCDEKLSEQVILSGLCPFMYEPMDDVVYQHMAAHLSGVVPNMIAHSFKVNLDASCKTGEICVEYVSGSKRRTFYVTADMMASASVDANANFSMLIEHFASHMGELIAAAKGCNADGRLVNMAHTKFQEAFMCLRRAKYDCEVAPDGY